MTTSALAESILDPEIFLEAQNRRVVSYSVALAEIQGGRKTRHWIWYIFPQLSGLGSSGMSATYAIPSLREAKVYLDHPILGTRLREISKAVLDWRSNGRNIVHLMGSEIDKLKLWASMTLFRYAENGSGGVFKQVLDKYFKGEVHEDTKQKLLEWILKRYT